VHITVEDDTEKKEMKQTLPSSNSDLCTQRQLAKREKKKKLGSKTKPGGNYSTSTKLKHKAPT
jgi:hypothetical protein